jgi:hypothetical protein
MAALRECEAEAQENGDVGLLHVIRFGLGFGELTQGRILEGLRILRTNSLEVQGGDNFLNRYVDKLHRAAVLLSIGLGRVDKATPIKLGLRDFLLVLSEKPFALARAQRLLRECETCPLWQNGGVFQAQVQLGLGRIHKARRRTDLARQCLQMAKRYAEAEGAVAIARRADMALADLYQSAAATAV